MSSIDEECVITGISGRFPESDNIEELWWKLINGHPLTTRNEKRWPSGLYSLPPITGRIKSVNKVDADFFDLSDEINYIDPCIRIDYEVIFEAIWDAGVNVFDLKGTHVSLIRNVCNDDTYAAFANLPKQCLPRNPVGKIAADFGFMGPCFEIDAACASSLLALNEGFNLMKNQLCQSLVVVGNSLHLSPSIANGFKVLKMNAADGTSKCLDNSADGYCRSEAIAALYVQRRRDAKRIYASILSCATNTDGYKEEGITYPKYSTQTAVMKSAIKEANIDPLDIEYIEAHITGTAAGDPVECRSILKAFRGDSQRPLSVGCLKSNIGHTEASSGVCAITKVALVFQNGQIPANLYYSKPNTNIEGLINGRLVPVIKQTKLIGEITAVSSFGFGGANVTCILKANQKRLSDESFRIADTLPRLINICGRTEDGINHAIDWIDSNRRKVTVDFLSLLNDVSKTPLNSKMNYRGYMIIDENNNCVKKSVSKNFEKRELWFVFGGFGAYWPAMAAELMHFKPFETSIKKTAEIANNLGIDLINVLTNPEFELRKHIKECAIGTIAVQLALYDTLTYVGLIPDKYISVSLGEIACAIVDGCLSREEAFVFFANSYDEIAKQCSTQDGSMITVEGDIMHIEQFCPNGLYLATDLRAEGIHSFGGKKKQIMEFSKRLTAANIAWTVDETSNVVLHCEDNNLRVENNSVFGNKSETQKFFCSPKWIRTSTENEEQSVFDKYSFIKQASTKLHLQRMIDSIPEDACVVELNCQPVTLGILKIATKVNCTFVTTMRKSANNIRNILAAIGDIYTCGHNPETEKLYPKVDYPVARETASLSHLFKWDHSKDYFVAKYPEHFNYSFKNRKAFNLKSSEFNFIRDHTIDGRVLFPATGYIYYAWAQFSVAHGFAELCPHIEFRNFKILQATIADKECVIKLEIAINRLSGDFVITSQNNVCVTGNARISSPMKNNFAALRKTCINLDQDSTYKELRVRGYDYGPHFQGIIELDSNGQHSKVKKTSHFISYCDSVLHLLLFNQKSRDLFIPTQIESLCIDWPRLSKSFENEKETDVHYEKETGILYSDGIIAKNVVFILTARQSDPNLLLRYYSFTPFDNHFCYSAQEWKTIAEHNSLCLSLIQSLKNQNFDLNERLIEDLNRFVGDRFAMLKSLETAVQDKLSLNEFIAKLSDKELNSFPLTLNKKELIEEQIQIFLQNKETKQISVIEINDTEYTFEDTVKELCRLADCRCDYKVLKSDFIEQVFTSVDFIIIRHFSSQFVLTRNKKEAEFLQRILHKSFDILRNGGFLLVYFRTKLTDVENEMNGNQTENGANIVDFTKNNINNLFSRIAMKTDSLHFTSILLRKIRGIENEAVIETSGQQFNWVNDVKHQLKNNNYICLKAQPNEINGVIGLAKCLQEEYGSHRLRSIIEDHVELGKELFSNNLSLNIKKKNYNGTLTLKQLNQELVNTKHAYIDIVTRGDMRSLQWIEAPHKFWDEMTFTERGKTNFLISVHYSALNFKDVMIATNRIPFSAFPMNEYKSGLIGMEFSGIDENGKRIFGICEKNSITTTLVQNVEGFHFEVPSNWTLKESSTVSVVYATVYYALIMRAKLLRNETVLIHAGSGGVGQAAIRLCLSMNCEVFTSVGNEEKKAKIMELFPQLKKRNFVDSRSVSFEEKIMKATNGRGVDVVLNSLSEEKFQASINCVAEGGRFIEIGKYDIVNDNKFVQQHRNVSFEVICLAHLLFDAFENKRNSAIKKVTELRELIKEGIDNGTVQPLNATTFSKDQVEGAFRFMAAGKHFGKVIIEIREENENEVFVEAIPKAYFYPSKVYLIVGGLGGMGLQLAFWLSERGARKLVLTTRRGITDNYQRYIIELIEKNGAEVTTIVNDLSDWQLAQNLLLQCTNIGPIGAIFNVAVFLSDQIFDDLTPESMSNSCKPKITATKFLDECSRRMCPKIDYFVCFSTIIASMGNVGQSNYAFANSAMEMICKRRKRDGMHALAIEWGLIGDVGVYIDQAKRNDNFILGMKPQRIFSCYETLDVFLASKHTVCASSVHTELKESISQVGDIAQQILHILGVTDTIHFDEKTTIAELGADSLMAVEIRQMLEKDFNIHLSSQQIKQLSFSELRKYANAEVPFK